MVKLVYKKNPLYKVKDKIFQHYDHAALYAELSKTVEKQKVDIEKITKALNAGFATETAEEKRIRLLREERAELESDVKSKYEWKRNAAHKALFKHKMEHGEVIE